MSVRRGEEKTPSLARGFFLLPASMVLVLDQFTKVLVQTTLLPGTSQPVFPRIFHLTLVENQGIAFGLFQGGEKILLGIITLSIAVLIGIGFLVPPTQLRTHVGVGLILGGAVGNWIDRIRVGAVIDFLDFRIWPVFNLADTAITLGVGLFLIQALTRHLRKIDKP